MLHPQNVGRSTRRSAATIALLLGACAAAFASPSASVFVDDLTSPELQARIKAGASTVLVPIGGTEQSGPHIALGKHNVRARLLAARIAQRLGNAVVAPVIAYVPEGAITPPAGHMRFAGTISIPDAAFESMLEATARSFCQHGMRDVFFLGDHGGYQKNEAKAAARVNREPGCRVHALTEYYRVTQTDYVAELKRRGYGEAEIGLHAGLADTALTLALDPSLVRAELLSSGAGRGAGVNGDPRRATAALGQPGVDRIVEASTAAIRAALQTPQTKPGNLK